MDQIRLGLDYKGLKQIKEDQKYCFCNVFIVIIKKVGLMLSFLMK